MRTPLIVGILSVFFASAAQAGPPLVLDSQIGPAFLMKSRSKSIGHGFKPMARVGLRVPILPRLEVGATLSGLVDASEHYRVLGLMAHGRFGLWQRPRFSLGAQLALGAGYNADILHADLSASAPVVPYGFVAFDARWALGDRWLCGVEAGSENLSMARIGLLVGFRFDGAPPTTLAGT
jgi:hypothetical protein